MDVFWKTSAHTRIPAACFPIQSPPQLFHGYSGQSIRQNQEYIYRGYDVGQIARAMGSDINLVALKVAELNRRGYRFREQDYRSYFLK